MGRGMMGPMMSTVAMRIIFALMDSDSDGTVSLQEFLTAHERIQGNGRQQRWCSHSGGNSVFHAWKQCTGSATIYSTDAAAALKETNSPTRHIGEPR
jgi:hypothetical protein